MGSSVESVQGDFTEKILRGILEETQSGKEMNEGDKQNDEKYRGYYNGKTIALALEDKNNSRLILYPSLSGEKDEWYKMGGQSALFYKYIIGPRLKKKPIIRKDNDLRHSFKHGVVAVHWGDKFMQDVTGLGLKVKRIDYGLIIVEMERTYSAKEIDEMRKSEKKEQDKLKKILLPEKNYPDLYGVIRQLAKIIPPKIKRMDKVYRDTIGNAALEVVIKLVEIYFQMSNGRMAVSLSRKEMLAQVDNMTALLVIIDENQLFDLTTRTRIGEILVDIRMTIERRLT